MTISVVTTVDKRETLEKMGRTLLERRLVACLQVIGPIRSTYWWEDRLEETEEWIGVMKTRDDLYEEVERAVRALHPYEVPEIAGIETDRVFSLYEKWIVGETSAAGVPHESK